MKSIVLLGVGAVGLVGAVVGACVASKKTKDILKEHHERIEALNDKEFEMPSEDGTVKPLTDKERKELKAAVRKKTALNLIKNYWVSIVGVVVAVASVIGYFVITNVVNTETETENEASEVIFDEQIA